MPRYTPLQRTVVHCCRCVHSLILWLLQWLPRCMPMVLMMVRWRLRWRLCRRSLIVFAAAGRLQKAEADLPAQRTDRAHGRCHERVCYVGHTATTAARRRRHGRDRQRRRDSIERTGSRLLMLMLAWVTLRLLQLLLREDGRVGEAAAINGYELIRHDRLRCPSEECRRCCRRRAASHAFSIALALLHGRTVERGPDVLTLMTKTFWSWNWAADFQREGKHKRRRAKGAATMIVAPLLIPGVPDYIRAGAGANKHCRFIFFPWTTHDGARGEKGPTLGYFAGSEGRNASALRSRGRMGKERSDARCTPLRFPQRQGESLKHGEKHEQ